MTLKSTLYRALRISNDVTAVERTIETGDPTYITNRIGRRLVYRASNQIARTLFPPHRRRG